MKTIGNIIWLLFGGLFVAIEYFVASIPLFITIIGIPFGVQALKLGMLALWPYGIEIKIKKGNPGLTHILFGILFGITIVGIPFAKQHFKLASLALTPFGRDIIFR
jgi:uncharacterized membrane protein YccF (DUF307 family)